MFTREYLLKLVFTYSGVVCLLLSLVLFFWSSNPAFLLFAPFSGAGFVLSLIVSKYLRVSRDRVEHLGRHVEEVTRHLEKQERLTEEVRHNESLFRGTFESSSVGALLVSEEGKIERVNGAFCRMTGYSAAELADRSFFNCIHSNDRQEVLRITKRLAQLDDGDASLEIMMNPSDGEERWFHWSASLLPRVNGSSRSFIFHLYDITDRKRAEARINHDAFHDSLTDLPNRALFYDRVTVAHKRSHRNLGTRFAIAFLDLDRFKLVNDTYGHHFGDELLCRISDRLTSFLRDSDTVARLGGDEFAILIEEAADTEEVVDLFTRLLSELSNEYRIGERSVFATFSIGIAFWNREFEAVEDLHRAADTALFKAKQGGRNQSVIFEPEMNEGISRFLEVEVELRKSIGRDEFRVQYQPIVQLADGRLSGFEALIRWEHPVHGLISPAEFIPIAEETGLIIQIGEWILEQACRQLVSWKLNNPRHSHLWMSVNASCRQFEHPGFVGCVSSVLDRTGFPPEDLKLEITESMMVDNLERIIDTMRQLNDLGVKISIDDFGTGYSSLNNLHRLPLSTLKIDRSFVSRIDAGNEGEEMIRTIVSIAKTLRFEVVAEGIETKLQSDHLADLQCEFGQGYYFSRPLTADGARELLERGSLLPSGQVGPYRPENSRLAGDSAH